ncbi:hypothetical protein NEUTE2DRAFT_130636 [Neurospora tetrasperma FGSC 2509]|nr:hypothetical protein NEUTE2DRAFT_130636 [Neurospora tetrasperma FGSC 2509]
MERFRKPSSMQLTIPPSSVESCVTSVPFERWVLYEHPKNSLKPVCSSMDHHLAPKESWASKSSCLTAAKPNDDYPWADMGVLLESGKGSRAALQLFILLHLDDCPRCARRNPRAEESSIPAQRCRSLFLTNPVACASMFPTRFLRVFNVCQLRGRPSKYSWVLDKTQSQYPATYAYIPNIKV